MFELPVGRSFRITWNKADKGTCMANNKNMAESVLPSSYQDQSPMKKGL